MVGRGVGVGYGYGCVTLGLILVVGCFGVGRLLFVLVCGCMLVDCSWITVGFMLSMLAVIGFCYTVSLGVLLFDLCCDLRVAGMMELPLMGIYWYGLG